jgi:hypothetical protein
MVVGRTGADGGDEAADEDTEPDDGEERQRDTGFRRRRVGVGRSIGCLRRGLGGLRAVGVWTGGGGSCSILRSGSDGELNLSLGVEYDGAVRVDQLQGDDVAAGGESGKALVGGGGNDGVTAVELNFEVG